MVTGGAHRDLMWVVVGADGLRLVALAQTAQNLEHVAEGTVGSLDQSLNAETEPPECILVGHSGTQTTYPALYLTWIFMELGQNGQHSIFESFFQLRFGPFMNYIEL